MQAFIILFGVFVRKLSFFFLGVEESGLISLDFRMFCCSINRWKNRHVVDKLVCFLLPTLVPNIKMLAYEATICH